MSWRWINVVSTLCACWVGSYLSGLCLNKLRSLKTGVFENWLSGKKRAFPRDVWDRADNPGIGTVFTKDLKIEATLDVLGKVPAKWFLCTSHTRSAKYGSSRPSPPWRHWCVASCSLLTGTVYTFYDDMKFQTTCQVLSQVPQFSFFENQCAGKKKKSGPDKFSPFFPDSGRHVNYAIKAIENLFEV